MATNPYFDNFNYQPTQDLIEELVIEAIKMYGLDTWYLPRTITRDPVYREAEYTEFNSAHSVEMYVRSTSGYAGEGKMMNMMGVEIRDEMTFSVAVRSFIENVGTPANLVRPREGDLVYFAPAQKAFQITYVDKEAVFYQMGSVQFYDVTAELFEYSNEKFATGVPELDDKYNDLQSEFTTDGEHDNDFAGLDHDAQNEEFQTEAQNIMDWDEHDPFSEGGTY